jgi:hypothetical protein
MCGRFTIRSNLKKVAEEFNLSEIAVLQPVAISHPRSKLRWFGSIRT